MEAGTLKELNLKPGDVVEWGGFTYIAFENPKPRAAAGVWAGTEEKGWVQDGNHNGLDTIFRLISRATPKTWGEMTDAEKGALLLAAHEGKVIEWDHHNNFSTWEPCDEDCLWDDEFYYRVRPEPVRETVTLTGYPARGYFHHDLGSQDTHRITFTTENGKPVCDSIRMEEL